MDDQNELVELDIDNVAHGGVTVARLDGRVVFVADAIPGERVLARIADDSKASFWRADTVEVLTASPDRRPHVWAAAGIERAPERRAGGAEFGHIALERQRALKSQVLTDALRRFGGVERVVEVEAIGADASGDTGARAGQLDGETGALSGFDGAGRPDAAGLHPDDTRGHRAGRGTGTGSDDGVAGRAWDGGDADARERTEHARHTEGTGRTEGTGWRSRVQLHVGAGGRVGPYAARSHQVVEVDDLPLATSAIEAEALEVMRALRGDAQGAAAVEFIETSEGELRVVLVAEERSKTGGRGGPRGRGARGSDGRGRGSGRLRGVGLDDGGHAGHAAIAVPRGAGGAGGQGAVHGAGSRTGGRGAGAAEGAGHGAGSRTGGRGAGAADGAGAARPAGGRGARAAGTGTGPAATIVERVGDREFRLAENGFWQVHRDAARTLTRAVQELTRADLFDPRASNHDLYGGVGLLAAAVGDRFGPGTRITTVESDPAATDHAASNLAEWIGARAVTGRVDRYLAELEKDATADDRRRLQGATMVIDPPRSGAGKDVVNSLVRLSVAQVVYVACDPVAFARDVGLFREGGYELDRVRAYDLFPHTHHVETVGVLVKP